MRTLTIILISIFVAMGAGGAAVYYEKQNTEAQQELVNSLFAESGPLSEWHEVVDRKHGYRVEFPAKTKTQRQEVPAADGKPITIDFHMVKHGDVFYAAMAVSIRDYENPAYHLVHGMFGMLAKSSTPVDLKITAVGENKLDIQYKDVIEGKSLLIKNRLEVHGRRLYNLGAIVEQGGATADDRFFDSFQLVRGNQR
jgi:hypothetical protein